MVFVVWYITAGLETIINIAVSSRWEVLTFAGTHLIKRMSLLTLIICKSSLSLNIVTSADPEKWERALLLCRRASQQ